MENKDSFIPAEVDETDEIEHILSRTILRNILVTAGFSVIYLVGGIFFKAYQVHIILTATVIFNAYCSYIVGCRWQKIDRTTKLAFLATICVFTIIGFLIVYYLAPIPHTTRLAASLKFAVSWPTAMVIPACIGFYLQQHCVHNAH